MWKVTHLLHYIQQKVRDYFMINYFNNIPVGLTKGLMVLDRENTVTIWQLG